MTGERRDVRGDDPETQRDREGDRGENSHLDRHVAEGSVKVAGHGTAV